MSLSLIKSDSVSDLEAKSQKATHGGVGHNLDESIRETSKWTTFVAGEGLETVLLNHMIVGKARKERA